MRLPGSHPSRRFTVLALSGLVAISAIACGFKGGGLHLVFDIRQYLDTAYHIAHDGTYTDADTAAPAPPAIGPEPGYPLLLAALMRLDPAFGSFVPRCLDSASLCDPRIYRIASLANVFFILASGLVMFLVAFRVCGSRWGALATAVPLPT